MCSTSLCRGTRLACCPSRTWSPPATTDSRCCCSTYSRGWSSSWSSDICRSTYTAPWRWPRSRCSSNTLLRWNRCIWGTGSCRRCRWCSPHPGSTCSLSWERRPCGRPCGWQGLPLGRRARPKSPIPAPYRGAWHGSCRACLQG